MAIFVHAQTPQKPADLPNPPPGDERELYKEERYLFDEDTRNTDGCYMETFETLDSSEKTIAFQGGRWPQTFKEEGDNINIDLQCIIWEQRTEGDNINIDLQCIIWEQRTERPNVGGVSVRSRNGAPSRRGCVVNGQMTQASIK